MTTRPDPDTTVHPVDEILPTPRLFALGLQHVLVMYAGAVAVPLILGAALKLPKDQIALLINADLLCCGIVTLIQALGVGAFGDVNVEPEAGEALFGERLPAGEPVGGIDGPDVLDAIGKVPARPVVLSGTRQIIEHASDKAFAPTGLTSHKTTFHRRDVIQLACEQAPQGASVSQIERLADAILDHAADRIVQLRSPSTPVAEGFAVRADGVRLTDHRADTAYTTVELLDHELAIIHTAHARADERAAQLDPKHVERHLDTRPANRTLADEQRRMVLALTTSGSGIEAVVGLAGAGKTFSLDAAHDAWHARLRRGCGGRLRPRGGPCDAICRMGHRFCQS